MSIHLRYSVDTVFKFATIKIKGLNSNNTTDILSDYEKAAEFFSKNGLDVKAIVFPGGSASNKTCVDVAKNVYSYGFKAGTNKTNYKHSIERWGIDRYSISPGDTLTRENLKNMLDELKQGDTGWMVWMIHTSSNTFQQNEADIIAEMIDYAQENGIQVVTAEYAVEYYLEE